MKEGKFDEQHVYQILLTVLPALSVTLLLNEALHIGTNAYLIGLLVAFYGVILRVLDANKKYWVFRIALIAVLILLTILLIYQWNYVIFLGNKVKLVATDKISEDSITFLEGLCIHAIVDLLCTIPIYFLQKVKTTRFFTAGCILILFVAVGTQGYMLHFYAITFAALYVLLIVGELYITIFVKKRQADSRKIMVYLVPLFLLYIVFVANMQVSEKPVDLHVSIVNGIKTTVTNWYHDIKYMISSNHGEYGVNMTGYSEDAGFDGMEESDNTIQFTVSSQKPMGQALYLRGNWKNEYSGHNWKENVESSSVYDVCSEDSLDWTEMMYALYRYDRMESANDLVRIDNLDIQYDDIETSSIFLPIKATNIKAGIALDNKTSENLNFGKLMREGNRYQCSQVKLNYKTEAWDAFVKQAEQYAYSSVNQIDLQDYKECIEKHKIGVGLGCYITNEELLFSRAAYIRKEYTELPEELPERVRQLTKEITKDCTSSMEKCRAIEAYLKNYTYTLQPEIISKDKDLVDSFLFETREGYCSYFASAMAVMVRTLNLPSRYAQGFVVEGGNRPNSKMNVGSNAAHAWVEVYIEGIGWLTFDPTPGGGSGISEEYSWGDVNQVYVPQNEHSTEDINAKSEELQKYYEELAKGKNDAKASEAKKEELLWWMLFLLGGMILIGLVMISLYVVIKIWHNKKELKKKTIDECLYIYMAQVFYLLEVLHYPIQPAETFHVYWKRIDKTLEGRKPALPPIEKIYTEARYNKCEVNETDLEPLQQFKEYLLSSIKEGNNRFHYVTIYLRYVMKSF